MSDHVERVGLVDAGRDRLPYVVRIVSNSAATCWGETPAKIAITLDLYGDLYPDEMDTWADRLDGLSHGQMWPERGQNDEDDEDGTAGVPANL